MYLHLNRMALMTNGFEQVADYRCIKKGERTLYIECYVKRGAKNTYVVRHWRTGRTAWDSVFDKKEDANAQVKKILAVEKENGAWVQRIH